MKPHPEGNGKKSSEQSSIRGDHHAAVHLAKVVSRTDPSKNARVLMEAGKKVGTPIRAGSSSKSIARDNKGK